MIVDAFLLVLTEALAWNRASSQFLTNQWANSRTNSILVVLDAIGQQRHMHVGGITRYLTILQVNP